MYNYELSVTIVCRSGRVFLCHRTAKNGHDSMNSECNVLKLVCLTSDSFVEDNVLLYNSSVCFLGELQSTFRTLFGLGPLFVQTLLNVFLCFQDLRYLLILHLFFRDLFCECLCRYFCSVMSGWTNNLVDSLCCCLLKQIQY